MAKFKKITPRNRHPRNLLNRAYKPFQPGRGIRYEGHSGHSIVTKHLKASRKLVSAVKSAGGTYE